jgi:hypothetical protein
MQEVAFVLDQVSFTDYPTVIALSDGVKLIVGREFSVLLLLSPPLPQLLMRNKVQTTIPSSESSFHDIP